MADIDDDWSADSNEALQISLVNPGENGTTSMHTFNPKFTYPVFGDEERIFGYKGLSINLKYNASDMRPGLQITYNTKFKAVGDVEPTDLKEILEPFLPKTAFEKTSVFDSAISAVPADWHPPGELYKSIENGSETYEIWKGNLADLAVQQMIKRIQILVPLFIEGGTLLELDVSESDLERWTVFFLYNRKPVSEGRSGSPYVFMGYSTVYRYWFYVPEPAALSLAGERTVPDFTVPVEDVTFSSLPCRSRISQFVIMPPFQGGGHGSRFYNAIFEHYTNHSPTREITVEDPNEAFDDLRDINDLFYLRKNPSFLALKINPSIKIPSKGRFPLNVLNADREDLRMTTKIAPRQFARVHEMQLLASIPPSVKQAPLIPDEKRKDMAPPSRPEDKHVYHLWQLLVKQRLYRHNKDALAQLEQGERIDKLDQTLSSVETDYERLVKSVQEREEKEKQKEGNAVVENSDMNENINGNGKGKRPAEDDMDGESQPLAKRVKTTT